MIQEKIGNYEIYRIVTDYEGLREGFYDRVDDINVPRWELDAAAGLQSGYSGKSLCNPPIKILGMKSLGGMLKATGMALVLVIDDEKFAPLKATMNQRKRPVRAPVASIGTDVSKEPVITDEMLRKAMSEHMKKLGKMGNKSNGGKRRAKTMGKRARQRAASHAARMRWAKRATAAAMHA